jgi:hypothetical protein
LKTPEGRKLYALRKQTPEPVFGIIKSVLGFRQFLLRGLDKVRGEWSLVTMAWNIKRMPADTRVGFHPDDTTPIPRPSRYYGRRQDLVTRDRAQGRRELEVRSSVGSSIVVPASPSLVPAQIDKSLLTVAEPKRLRDKAHLRFVASQPCLVCGRQPSDPHHLRFAQPRALGLKVSDEFTVPLCRGHHRQLHQAGNEVAWWEGLKINALPIAKGLWEQTRPKSAAADTQQPNEDAAEAPIQN